MKSYSPVLVINFYIIKVGRNRKNDFLSLIVFSSQILWVKLFSPFKWKGGGVKQNFIHPRNQHERRKWKYPTVLGEHGDLLGGAVDDVPATVITVLVVLLLSLNKRGSNLQNKQTTKQQYPPLSLVNFLWFVDFQKDSAFPLVNSFFSFLVVL